MSLGGGFEKNVFCGRREFGFGEKGGKEEGDFTDCGKIEL